MRRLSIRLLPPRGGCLILKRASASRPSGEWSDDDFDVLADGVVVGRIFRAAASPERFAVDVDAGLGAPRGPHADARLRADARGRDGGVREKLAEGIAVIDYHKHNGGSR